MFFIIVYSSVSFAQIDDVDVELITIGSGYYYWEAFGHTALRIKTKNYDYMYGFGYFNFEDEDFFLNFAKGEMQYFMGIQETESELLEYQNQGRKIWTQKLLLSSQQKAELLQILNFLSQPQNRYYHYDYFLNNCTSRIRDILNKITNDVPSKQLNNKATQSSWNDLTFPSNNQAWMNLGMAIAYGLPAYEDRNQWQLSIFPETFAEDLQSIKTKENWNQSMQVYYQPESEQVNHYSLLKTHYALFLVIAVVLLGLMWKVTSQLTTNTWLVVQSLLGIALLMLWFLTKHTVAAYNINVLLFFPLSFLLIFNSFKKPLYINLFLIINLTWLIIAFIFTNLYLTGFLIINLIIWNKIKRPKGLFYKS